jgi:hypothetical protein
MRGAATQGPVGEFRNPLPPLLRSSTDKVNSSSDQHARSPLSTPLCRRRIRRRSIGQDCVGWRSALLYHRHPRANGFAVCRWRREPPGPRTARPDDRLREPRRMNGPRCWRRGRRPSRRAPQDDELKVESASVRDEQAGNERTSTSKVWSARPASLSHDRANVTSGPRS